MAWCENKHALKPMEWNRESVNKWGGWSLSFGKGVKKKNAVEKSLFNKRCWQVLDTHLPKSETIPMSPSLYEHQLKADEKTVIYKVKL